MSSLLIVIIVVEFVTIVGLLLYIRKISADIIDPATPHQSIQILRSLTKGWINNNPKPLYPITITLVDADVVQLTDTPKKFKDGRA